jgi:hypothetical protein
LLAQSRNPQLAAATIAPMPRGAPRPDPFYAIRTFIGPWGIVYRVSFARHGKNVAKPLTVVTTAT